MLRRNHDDRNEFQVAHGPADNCGRSICLRYSRCAFVWAIDVPAAEYQSAESEYSGTRQFATKAKREINREDPTFAANRY
jgi:hypothetical protein